MDLTTLTLDELKETIVREFELAHIAADSGDYVLAHHHAKLANTVFQNLMLIQE
jgi:hypothetical protein